MKYFSIIFIIYLFLKSFNYAIFELNNKKNIPGGIFLIIISLISLIFPLILLITIY